MSTKKKQSMEYRKAERPKLFCNSSGKARPYGVKVHEIIINR